MTENPRRKAAKSRKKAAKPKKEEKEDVWVPINEELRHGLSQIIDPIEVYFSYLGYLIQDFSIYRNPEVQIQEDIYHHARFMLIDPRLPKRVAEYMAVNHLDAVFRILCKDSRGKVYRFIVKGPHPEVPSYQLVRGQRLGQNKQEFRISDLMSKFEVGPEVFEHQVSTRYGRFIVEEYLSRNQGWVIKYDAWSQLVGSHGRLFARLFGRALGTLHSCNYVYRDELTRHAFINFFKKPHQVKLIDFGAARRAKRDSELDLEFIKALWFFKRRHEYHKHLEIQDTLKEAYEGAAEREAPRRVELSAKEYRDIDVPSRSLFKKVGDKYAFKVRYNTIIQKKKDGFFYEV